MAATSFSICVLAAALSANGAVGLVPGAPSQKFMQQHQHHHARRMPSVFGVPTRFGYTTPTPTVMMASSSSSSDVSADSTSAEPSEDDEEDHEQSSASVPLFDASAFSIDDASSSSGATQPEAVMFEDIESEYDPLSPEAIVDSNGDGDDDSTEISSDYDTNNNALTDEEDRILTDQEDRLFQYINNTQKVESCILVGVENLSAARKAKKMARTEDFDMNLSWTLEESMTEMRELIKTSGLSLQGTVTQRLQEVNPRTYIGTGKVDEVKELMDVINKKLEAQGEGQCCTVVFDAELYPGQQKALENAFNRKVIENDFLGSDQEDVVKVVDRTALILDIFAQHAKTREGKLQVDLALHEYRKPRLTRMWTHLERQSGSGGVGLRGPGETQLEVDKRILRDRILVLKGKIDDVQKQRDLHRRGRKRGGLPVLAIVGYTNAGKSTLLNCLTKAGILAEDILFATLDPTTRRVKLPGYKTHPEVLLTDTVGFIQRLPTQLVAAFRATLEEVKEADVLVHIVDVSNPTWRKQEVSVTKVLEGIGAGDTPIVRVFNKLDLLDPEDADMLKYEAACAEDFSVGISSLTGEGLSDFVAVVEDALSDLLVPVELELPYSCGDDVNLIHEVGAIEVIDYREKGTYIMGRVPRSLAMRLEKYSLGYAEEMEKAADEIDWAALGKGRHEKKVQ